MLHRYRERQRGEKEHERDRLATLILPTRKALLSCMSVFVSTVVADGSSHSGLVFPRVNQSKIRAAAEIVRWRLLQQTSAHLLDREGLLTYRLFKLYEFIPHITLTSVHTHPSMNYCNLAYDQTFGTQT